MRAAQIGLAWMIALLGLAAPAAADLGPQPSWRGARIETRSVPPGGLAAALRALIEQQVEPAWIGYTAPLVAGQGTMCCWHGAERYDARCGRCRLEGGAESWATESDGGERRKPPWVELEGPTRFVVLLRAGARRLSKIRFFSLDCELDAGGLPVIWLGSAGGAESVAALAAWVEPPTPPAASERIARDAVAALALHDDPAADAALDRFLDSDRSAALHKEVLFWLGSARGRRGLMALRRVARSEGRAELRRQVGFALSLSREPEALAELIALARGDRSSAVRSEALFWLAQEASAKAVGAISEAVERDPDTQVKRQAVFGLSQLPAERGVPILIRLARGNKSPVVRKQALFWLGQSEDARAVAFFEEILLR
ncbi:MAG TPA: HEAT repeat domain-containing protein [Acidobacteriota bacterium]